MTNIIEKLFPYNATLLGEGYDARLNILRKELSLEIMEVPSGTEFGTWTVPEEWVVRDAWVKYKGKKILDYKKQPLSLVVGSLPFSGKVDLKELTEHLYWSDERPDATPYVMKYYEKVWGFCLPKEKKEKLKEGEYEIFIDTEYKPGHLKLAVHTIPGKSDREILLFAHLDHAFQANDNLSGVACMLDIKNRIKSDHTIKIILLPETIGSIAYAHIADLSKVEFVIAVDICGNDKPILMLKSFDPEAKINRIAHCALQMIGKGYNKGKFRATIGSDETVFNDPLIGIPGICLTTHDKTWLDYHTEFDTPDKIAFDKITEMADLILKIIDVADRDYIPKRNFKGPLFRTKYKLQSGLKQLNLNYDYFFYRIDGKISLAELCADHELNFSVMYEVMEKIITDGKITKVEITS
jgi:aminopeptidase-like protein